MAKKNKQKDKPARKPPKYLFHILSFLLPILILGTAFALHGVFPFGSRQILVTDYWQQYYPFLSDYWHKLREGSSLLWSWTSGAGSNYLAIIAYYLASPLNLIIALFPHAWLREVLVAVLLIKIGLAGLFFMLYLKYAHGRSGPALPVFAVFYALCAFTLGYYWTLMWFDTFALLPLTMLGALALAREGKCKLYITALALSVFINYYIGLFTCIFTAIMFLVYCLAERLGRRVFLRRLALIAGCSVIALGLTAMLTVPAFMSLQKSYSAVNKFPAALKWYESFVDILGNLIAFTPPTATSGLPNLYCGLLCLPLAGVFLRARRIPLREKLAYIGVAAFILVSCNLNALNYIWHGLHFTNMLPYRFSFLVSFLLAGMAYRAWTILGEEGVRIWDMLAMAVSSAAFIVLAALGRQETQYVIASAGLGGFYLLMFGLRMLYRFAFYPIGIISTADASTHGLWCVDGNNSHFVDCETVLKRPARFHRFINKTAAALILLAALGEVSVTAYIGVTTVRTTDRSGYPNKYNEVQELLALREEEPNGFYRTETTSWTTINDASLYGYSGASLFSSTVNVSTTYFMEGLGLHARGSGNRYCYSETTPLANMFLGIRYLVCRNGNSADGGVYWDTAGEYGGALLLENKRYLPLGFMADEALEGYTHGEGNQFDWQNDLFRRATGLEGELFTVFDIIHVGHKNYTFTRKSLGSYSYKLNEDAESGSFKWNYEAPTDGPLYCYLNADNITNIKVSVGGKTLRTISVNRPRVFCLGNFTKGELVSVMADMTAAKGSAKIYVASIDQELFDRGYELLADEVLNLTSFSDTRVTGTVTALTDGLLYTSIPWEKGWRAFVDGEEREVVLIDGGMPALRLTAGEHTVEFWYINDGLVIGAAVSLLSAAAFAGLLIIKKLLGRKRNE